MATNFPGPYQLRIFYEVGPGLYPDMVHVMQLNLALLSDPDLGTLFADIDVVARIVATHPLATVTDEISALMQPHFNSTDVTILYAELWKYEAGTFNATYVSSYVIDLPGTGIPASWPAGQLIYTFRTYEGGVMKVSLQETTTEWGNSVSYGDLSQEAQDFADYFTGDTASFFLARDTSYPFICLARHPGQNEALFKKRFRD